MTQKSRSPPLRTYRHQTYYENHPAVSILPPPPPPRPLTPPPPTQRHYNSPPVFVPPPPKALTPPPSTRRRRISPPRFNPPPPRPLTPPPNSSRRFSSSTRSNHQTSRRQRERSRSRERDDRPSKKQFGWSVNNRNRKTRQTARKAEYNVKCGQQIPKRFERIWTSEELVTRNGKRGATLSAIDAEKFVTDFPHLELS